MPGSLADPVRLGPFLRIVDVHWADDQPPDFGSIGIISVWRPGGNPWRFEARLWMPGSERWIPQNEYYITGPYQNGLGGDYSYSSAWRADPDGLPHFPNPGEGEFLLPAEGEIDDYYLWHTGYNMSGVDGAYDTLIVNIDKVIADFGSSDEPQTSLAIELAGLGGNFNWDFSVYRGTDSDGPGTFSVVGDQGRVTYSKEFIESRTGVVDPQIVSAMRLEYPFSF